MQAVFETGIVTECHQSCQGRKTKAGTVLVQALAIWSVLVQMHQTQKVTGVAVVECTSAMYAVAEKDGWLLMVSVPAAAGG